MLLIVLMMIFVSSSLLVIVVLVAYILEIFLVGILLEVSSASTATFVIVLLPALVAIVVFSLERVITLGFRYYRMK